MGKKSPVVDNKSSGQHLRLLRFGCLSEMGDEQDEDSGTVPGVTGLVDSGLAGASGSAAKHARQKEERWKMD